MTTSRGTQALSTRAGLPAPLVSLLAVAALLVSLGLATSQAASASPDSPRRATCRGPASLSGFFKLTDRRKIAAKRTSCAKARKVVRRFPKSCSNAYAAQGGCKVRASGRWRCRSRIVGTLEDGAPSKEKCKRRRSRLRFEVAYFWRPFEPASIDAAHASRGPYNESGRCVDTSEPGTVIPPPDLGVGSWEIHLTGGVRRGVGDDLQSSLIDHRVAAVLHAGLGTQPRNHPDRTPIFLTPDYVRRRGSLGVRAPTCENESLDGIVVSTRKAALVAMVAAHELFHAYGRGLNPDVAVSDVWWEEASATWSTGRVGFPEVTQADINLQYPQPLDSMNPRGYRYAMSRFVQFVDDRGFIGDTTWPLQRQVIDGYVDPGATAALATAIKDRASTLGAELAAFWGDRLRANPLHGPQLRPSARNATRIRARPGTREVTAKADRLDTSLVNFTLAADVKRVEFEFDPPAENGFLWGLVSPDESRPFRDGDSVSFCVGGGDDDDLEWPGHFPVTFTNGALGAGTIAGTITIRAQTSAEQCTNPLLNRACRLLDRARVERIFGGPGTLVPQAGFVGSRLKTWECGYQPEDIGGASASLDLARYRRGREARRGVRTLLHGNPSLGLPPMHRIEIGDLAGISTPDDFPDHPEYATVVAVAVGRYSFGVAGYMNAAEDDLRNIISRAKPITLARRVAHEVD